MRCSSAAAELAVALGGRRSGRGWIARCPAHRDRHASLGITGGADDRLLLRCFAGCSWSSIRAALEARSFWPGREAYVPRSLQAWRTSHAPCPPVLEPDKLAVVKRVWRNASPAPGTQVEIYLRTRSLTTPVPPTLRYARLRHLESGRRLPCMVAAVQAADGRLTGLHRTYLRPNGGGKADMEPAKKMLGACRGGVVRLTPVGRRLALCEGIETGLSIREACPDLAVWCALSAGNLDRITLPPLVDEVVLVADGDPVGLEAAHRAALRRERPADSPGRAALGNGRQRPAPRRGRGMSATRLKDMIEGAPEVDIEPPRPLQRPLEPADPFAMEALGSVLGGAALAIVDQVQCPEAIAGQSVLAVATLAVQGHADIELPQGSTAPLSGFFLTVACSGERKSTADRKALWPIRQREKALRAQHDDAMPAYMIRQASWEASRKQILGNKKLSHEAKHTDLEGLGPPPEPPLTPLLACPEPTFEGLCLLLQSGHPSVGVFSAEGGQFLGGYGMSKDHRLKTAAALSGLWDGEPIKRVRRGDGVILLPGRRVAMHLLVQPGVSNLLLGSRELHDQGLVSRVLASAPATTAGSRFWRDTRPESERAMRRYGARILEILEQPLPLEHDKPHELAPRTLKLASPARQRLIAFMDHVERQLAPKGPLAAIRAFANKVPEHAARLGGVLALVDRLDLDEVSSHHLEAGILLAEHYTAEARRLHEAGHNDPELDLAQRVLDWLAGDWPGRPLISVPDLYTFGPAPVRDKRTASRTIDILEDHGWLVRENGQARVNGTMRREVWRLAFGATR